MIMIDAGPLACVIVVNLAVDPVLGVRLRATTAMPLRADLSTWTSGAALFSLESYVPLATYRAQGNQL